MTMTTTNGQGHGPQAPDTIKFLGQRFPSDDYRVRLDYAEGKRRYRRFATELDARAFIGRIIAQWEGGSA